MDKEEKILKKEKNSLKFTFEWIIFEAFEKLSKKLSWSFSRISQEKTMKLHFWSVFSTLFFITTLLHLHFNFIRRFLRLQMKFMQLCFFFESAARVT